MLVPSKHVKVLPATKKGYQVICTCGNYASGPLYRGTAQAARDMHEMLGKGHVCYFVRCGTSEVYSLEKGSQSNARTL